MKHYKTEIVVDEMQFGVRANNEQAQQVEQPIINLNEDEANLNDIPF